MVDLLELVAKLRAALKRCADESDYCYACDRHPAAGGGHGSECPAVWPSLEA